MDKRVLAFDFGASSGRAMLGTFDGSRIEIEEIHRFSNEKIRHSIAVCFVADKRHFIHDSRFFVKRRIRRENW